jgi:hypothetical protein
MWEDVDWSLRAKHLFDRHGLTPAMASEALRDPSRVVIDPDPKSKSGRGVRVVGWSQTRLRLLTVIVLEDEGQQYGLTAFPSNSADQRIYDEAQ